MPNYCTGLGLLWDVFFLVDCPCD